MKKTVYVGMSGGVDSSVTAALLVRQNYRVVGVFMKNWTKDVLGFSCPWREDLADAKSVAAKLNIPIKVFDFQKAYKQSVVDYMVEQYRDGFTPNPDVMCNQEIKFKLFLKTALDDGADMIATGHYGRILRTSRGSKLAMAKDAGKDQSYFLYRITNQALKKTLFPLGELTKTEVRKLARDFGLPNADKPDSVGICFIGEVDLKNFLKEYIKPKLGEVKSMDGKKVGKHDGVAFYTIGQRHGLNIGGGRPYYVVGKDVKANIIYVTDNPADETLHKSEFVIRENHWIDEPPQAKNTYQIRTRYRGNLIDGKLSKSAGGYRVTLSEPERAITPGQSAVVYDGESVVGGGIIELA